MHHKGKGVSLCAISCRNLIPKLQGAVHPDTDTNITHSVACECLCDENRKYNTDTNTKTQQKTGRRLGNGATLHCWPRGACGWFPDSGNSRCFFVSYVLCGEMHFDEFYFMCFVCYYNPWYNLYAVFHYYLYSGSLPVSYASSFAS